MNQAAVPLRLDNKMAADLEQLYLDMETAYDHVARSLDHCCDGCLDNCCDSYFSHHTYIEWAYLWHGMVQRSRDEQRDLIGRARGCERDYASALAKGEIPTVMCPLNDGGRCTLYPYRLMVCRTHGVPASMTRPDGRVVTFPGCFRCAQTVQERNNQGLSVSVMERTALLQRLAVLEKRFLEQNQVRLPRLRITIARMLTGGPP